MAPHPQRPWGGALDPVTGRRAYNALYSDGQAPQGRKMQKLCAQTTWRPADEAAAAGNMAAFILWLAACRGRVATGAGWVEAWAAADPAAFAEAISGFAGIEPGLGYAHNLARSGGRLVLRAAGGRWQAAAAVLAGDAMPDCIAAMLAAGGTAMLAGQAADHLLRLEVRADETVLWAGPVGDPWPLGALLAGATLVLCDPPPDDAEAVAAAEAARVIRRPV